MRKTKRVELHVEYVHRVFESNTKVSTVMPLKKAKDICIVYMWHLSTLARNVMDLAIVALFEFIV